MPNVIYNATGLDGATSYNGSAAVVAHESGIGAPGRIVIAGGSYTVANSALSLNGASGVWAFSHFLGNQLRVVFADDAQAPVGAGVVLPVIREAEGSARRGLPASFRLARGWAPAPVGATKFLLAAEGGVTALLKPFGQIDGGRDCVWQPGPHANIDLAYPSWPSDLPAIMDEGLQADPIATRKGFSGDSGVESTRRITRARRYRLTAQLALTLEEYDRLMQFFDDTNGPFWFTRPGTHEVCLAQWLADGEPVLAGRLPGRRRVQIKLQLRVP